MQTFTVPNIEFHSYYFFRYYIDLYHSIKLPKKVFAIAFIYLDIEYFIPIKYLAFTILFLRMYMPRIKSDGTVYRSDLNQKKEEICRVLSPLRDLKCFIKALSN
jgi:hypothetical protein